MHHYLAAAAANCNTGSWQQKWNCGWNQPATGAAHAGAFAGHDMLPALILLAVIFLAARLVRKAKKAARPAPAKAARR